MGECNGWANRETWLANIHFDDAARSLFGRMLDDSLKSGDFSVPEFRDRFIGSMELVAIGDCPGIDDFNGKNVGAIDWNDIFEHIASDSEALRGRISLNGREHVILARDREELSERIGDFLDIDMDPEMIGNDASVMTPDGQAGITAERLFQDEGAQCAPSM